MPGLPGAAGWRRWRAAEHTRSSSPLLPCCRPRLPSPSIVNRFRLCLGLFCFAAFYFFSPPAPPGSFLLNPLGVIGEVRAGRAERWKFCRCLLGWLLSPRRPRVYDLCVKYGRKLCVERWVCRSVCAHADVFGVLKGWLHVQLG